MGGKVLVSTQDAAVHAAAGTWLLGLTWTRGGRGSFARLTLIKKNPVFEAFINHPHIKVDRPLTTLKQMTHGKNSSYPWRQASAPELASTRVVLLGPKTWMRSTSVGHTHWVHGTTGVSGRPVETLNDGPMDPWGTLFYW